MSATATPAKAHPSVEKYARHVNPDFVKLLGVLGYGRVFTKAEGVWLWDHEGRRYLDFLAGFGAANLGHNHPRLLARLKAFLEEQAPGLAHVGPQPHAAELAERLSQLLPEPLQISLFSTSGAEAMDAAMKLARAATGRSHFLYCGGGFHGLNLGSLSVLGSSRMRKPFEPLLRGCYQVPFGELDTLDKALALRKPAAFIVEPVQAEAGVILPPAGYLREARELCRRHKALLILDEVQTGFGRTGSWFAFEPEGFSPDILVLAKAMGGALTPVAATVTSREIQERAYGGRDRFDLHGSTYAGYALGCAAALETLSVIREEGLVENSAARGRELLQGLRRGLAGHPLVRSVRGRGLLVGIELGPTEEGWLNRKAPGLVRCASRQAFGQWAALRLLERGIVCQPASQALDVLRLEPPLTVTAEQAAAAARAVAEVLNEYRSLPPLMADLAKRLGRQFLNAWEFS